MPVLDVRNSNLGQTVELPVPGRPSGLLAQVVDGAAVPLGTAGTIPVSNGSAFVATPYYDPTDPPALIVSIFGMSRVVAFSQSQILASNNEAPRYVWTPPAEISVFSVGPDGALYSGSTSGGGVMRYPLRGSGTLPRYRIAPLTNPGSNVCFAAQSPATGLPPWTMFAKNANPSDQIRRFNESVAQASTHPAWCVPDIFTSIGIDDFAFDAAGNLWAQDSSSAINRYNNPAGIPPLTTDVVIAGSNWPSSREGLAISSVGNFYSFRYNASDIRMLDAAGIAAIVGAGPSNPAPTAIITSTQLSGCEFSAFDYADNLWAVSYNNARILRFDAADLLTSGAKTPSIVLTGGGALGTGSATGPVCVRMFHGTGPVR